MQLVRHSSVENPKLFSFERKGGFGLPFSASGRRYYRALAGPELGEYGFSIVNGDRPVATVECDATLEDCLSRFGSPIEIGLKLDEPIEDRRAAVSLAFSEIKQLAKTSGFDSAILRTLPENDTNGDLASALLKNGAVPSPAFRAVVDLGLDDEILASDMSSHHRRQVRKGKKILELITVNKDNPEESLFEAFRNLHAEVAGRVTRRIESWEESFELIREGFGGLIISKLDGEMVGGTLTLDSDSTAFYASGAYKREYFQQPISHLPLFAGFSEARERGRKWYDVGDVSGEGAVLDDKQRQIASFKAGFTSQLQTSMVWRWSLEP